MTQYVESELIPIEDAKKMLVKAGVNLPDFQEVEIKTLMVRVPPTLRNKFNQFYNTLSNEVKKSGFPDHSGDHIYFITPHDTVIIGLLDNELISPSKKIDLVRGIKSLFLSDLPPAGGGLLQ